MADSKIKNKIRSILSKISKVNNFKDGEDILQAGIVDSLGAITLIYKLEEGFKIKIGQDEIKRENINTVSNIAAFIKRKVSDY